MCVPRYEFTAVHSSRPPCQRCHRLLLFPVPRPPPCLGGWREPTTPTQTTFCACWHPSWRRGTLPSSRRRTSSPVPATITFSPAPCSSGYVCCATLCTAGLIQTVASFLEQNRKHHTNRAAQRGHCAGVFVLPRLLTAHQGNRGGGHGKKDPLLLCGM